MIENPESTISFKFVSLRRCELKLPQVYIFLIRNRVRLLAETRVEILWHSTPDNKNPFVSARKRDLKSQSVLRLASSALFVSPRRRELK